MNSNQFNTAWEGIEKSWKNSQLAHAYLLQGAPHGIALRFAEKLLNLIFNHHPQVQTHTHPDIVWTEPQSKSRRIGIDEIRATIQQLSRTSFAGGWKASLIVSANRMTDQAANALLKTLEEPTKKTVLILISDKPQSLLPTILSRCQRIILADMDEDVSSQWTDPLFDILREFPPDSVSEMGGMSNRLHAILKQLYNLFEVEEQSTIPEDLSAKELKALLEARTTARMIEARTEILRTLLRWQRDVLMRVLKQDDSVLHFPEEKESLNRQAMCCTRADALKRIAAAEKMAHQFDRNLPAELIFNNFLLQLQQPVLS